MPLKITTWNINSVRLRINLVAKFIKSARPDVICLQETKCPDDAFPLKRFKRLGYEHAALYGQKGYHGVAIVSRLPFESVDKQNFCGKTDCRHISVVLGERDTALKYVGVALKAGMAPFEFESSPALAELVKDTRYLALTKEAASQVNRR